MTQSEIEKAAEEYAKDVTDGMSAEERAIERIVLSNAFLAGAEHAKQAERFRIVQLIGNLPEISIENITWGEIARLIEAPEAEK